MSTSKNNGKPDTFLAPTVLQLTGAISTAMDLLEAAGGLMLLREVLEPDTPEYENATQELAKFLSTSAGLYSRRPRHCRGRR